MMLAKIHLKKPRNLLFSAVLELDVCGSCFSCVVEHGVIVVIALRKIALAGFLVIFGSASVDAMNNLRKLGSTAVCVGTFLTLKNKKSRCEPTLLTKFSVSESVLVSESLYCAVESNSNNDTWIALSNGANPNGALEGREKLLHHAVINQNELIISMLLEKGVFVCSDDVALAEAFASRFFATKKNDGIGMMAAIRIREMLRTAQFEKCETGYHSSR